MSYKIIAIPSFEKQLKRLAKKYHSLIQEISHLEIELSENPITGTALGNNCFKIRLAISSKGKGKSGGARIITHIKIVNKTIYLLTIYDKSEKENISDVELINLLRLL